MESNVPDETQSLPSYLKPDVPRSVEKRTDNTVLRLISKSTHYLSFNIKHLGKIVIPIESFYQIYPCNDSSFRKIGIK